MSKNRTAVTPTRAENYPEWYQAVIKAADMAEISSVRGCMVIKPWGYAIWERMQAIMDGMIKESGHDNIYCPIFIPLSHLTREAQHVEGFATECAVVTHHRLEKDGQGGLVPTSPLEEPLIVRPTSETIIGESFAKWIQSYRDLPLLVNQWANVVRWEMRTRLFLRTTEFLWQEGHTAHATEREAKAETLKMLDYYEKFARDYLAIPVVKGEKSEAERFPGADATYCIEALMQDNKALQAGTSHCLGQNFSKAFDIQFLSQDGEKKHAWTTSWGTSTRLIGGLIMTHADDDGMVVPPRIAPRHVVILPIIHDETKGEAIYEACDQLAKEIQAVQYDHALVRVKVDRRDMRGGDKLWSWVRKGAPIRIEMGSRECDSGMLSVGLRTESGNQRHTMRRDELMAQLPRLLAEIQETLLSRAQQRQTENTREVRSKAEFYEFFEKHNGFVLAHFNGDPVLESRIKAELSVTIRCLPLAHSGPGQCIFTGEDSAQQVLFARAY